MSVTDRDDNDNFRSGQGPSVSLHQHGDGYEIRISKDAIAHTIPLFASFLKLAQDTLKAANDHVATQESQKRKMDVLRERLRERQKRHRIIRWADREIRKQGLTDEPSEAVLKVASDALGVERSVAVKSIQMYRRHRWGRLQAMRKAHAYRWADEGLSTAQIGKRLGIGARAANKLVRSEIDRRNQERLGPIQ